MTTKRGPCGCRFVGVNKTYPFSVSGYAAAADDAMNWVRTGDTKDESREGLLYVRCDSGSFDLLHCWFDKIEGQVRCQPSTAGVFQLRKRASHRPIAGLRRR